MIYALKFLNCRGVTTRESKIFSKKFPQGKTNKKKKRTEKKLISLDLLPLVFLCGNFLGAKFDQNIGK